MHVVRQSDAVAPLLQATPFAGSTENERSQEVVTLPNVLVPHGEHQGLLVQVGGSRLKLKLLIEDGIQIAPLDVRSELPFVTVRLGVF